MKLLTPRQESILNRIVDTHIETGQPVGSKHITELYTELYRKSYSPATVRNEMLHLETKGYLTHPHTSAGRVPTDQGYRYYVDHGLKADPVDPELSDQLREDLEKHLEQLQNIVNRTSLMLAQISGMACLLMVSNSEALEETEQSFYSFRGMGHFLEQEDFKNRKKLGLLLQFFEDREQLLDWLLSKRNPGRLSIQIGRENESEVFQDCSVVSTPIFRDRQTAGILALVGPRRMKYSRSIALVSGVAQTLSWILQHQTKEG